MTVSETKKKASAARNRKTAQPALDSPLTRVGVKEFRDRATQLLAQDAPFAVERHGKVIGFYTPLGPKNPESAAAAQEKYDRTMNGVARQLKLSREELDDLLWGEEE